MRSKNKTDHVDELDILGILITIWNDKLKITLITILTTIVI